MMNIPVIVHCWRVTSAACADDEVAATTVVPKVAAMPTARMMRPNKRVENIIRRDWCTVR